jgi:hypothetical protein
MARKPMIKLPGFEGVDDSGGGFHIAPNEYLMKCVGVTDEISKQGNNMLVFKFEGLEKASKGRSFRMHCTLGANALWKLKQTLRAMGIEVTDEPSELNPDDVVDIEVLGTVVDDTYEGKPISRLAEVRSPDEIEDDDKPAASKKPTASASKKNGNTKAQKFAASEVEEMAEDELFEINEKYDLGVELDTYKTTSKKRGAIIASLQANKMLEA